MREFRDRTREAARWEGSLEPRVGERVRVRAPGKVNIALAVGEREPDGYHQLATVFMAVSLYEDVSVTLRSEPGIRVTVNAASGIDFARHNTPLGEDNLVVKAARALADGAGPALLERFGLDIDITKNVPIAGGMAGGSADAAATLLACQHLWRLNLTRDELCAVAARLGADVPFSLLGGVAMGVGRGDQLTPVLNHIETNWVLVFADEGLSTPTVFAELDRLRDAQESETFVPEVEPELIAALRGGLQEELGAYLSNDLQVAALRLQPQLRDTMEAASDAGALASVVSGSGPTIAVLAADAEHADMIAEQLRCAGRQVSMVHGPVPGASIVEVTAR